MSSSANGEMEQSLLSAAEHDSSAAAPHPSYDSLSSSSSQPPAPLSHHPSTSSVPSHQQPPSSHAISIPQSTSAYAPRPPIATYSSYRSIVPAQSLPRHVLHRYRALQQPPYPQYAGFWDKWHALSRLSQVFLIVVPLLWPLCFIPASTRWLALFLPLITLPSLVFYYLYTRRYYAHAEINLLLHTYILGFTVAALAVLVVESVIAIAAVIPLLWDQLSTLMDALVPKDGQTAPASAEEILGLVKPTVGFYILLFVLAYISAGCCEEGMKYVLATRVKRWTPNFRNREGFLLYALAGALGFSTVENIGYAFNSLTPWYAPLVGVLTRVLISTPIHLACAYLVGIGVVRREVYGEPLPLWRVLGLPILLHGSFDFSLMIAAVNMDSDSVELLIIECVVVAVTAAVFALAIWRERKHIAADPPALLPTAMSAGQPVMNERQGRDAGLLAASAQ